MTTLEITAQTPAFILVAMVLVAILAVILRRPDQFNHPPVWLEEGSQFIAEVFIFEPCNGYIILPSKILALLTMKLSFTHYALASYVLALLFSGAVATAILKAPTLLPLRPLAFPLIGSRRKRRFGSLSRFACANTPRATSRLPRDDCPDWGEWVAFGEARAASVNDYGLMTSIRYRSILPGSVSIRGKSS